jgi:hypothetical protein
LNDLEDFDRILNSCFYDTDFWVDNISKLVSLYLNIQGGIKMKIDEFVSKFNNHPILFVGTGISLRYLKNSYSWDELLRKIAFDLKNNNEYYLDIKSNSYENSKYRYDKIATSLEQEFNFTLQNDRYGKFKSVNDVFYDNMDKDINISRFKIYISQLLYNVVFKEEKNEEILALKRVRKNIGSIITTNYDTLIEEIFEFNPLIGNDILLSNPYGSLYKIHGCVKHPDKIIITDKDYSIFEQKYELIRAQLLSLFIHNPIIFIGYNIGDENIKNILKTIFTYVEPNSREAEKIRGNFLLVEYEQNSNNLEVSEHDIDMEGFSTIRINKIKTDNYLAIYEALSTLQLPVSAMDVRKVQNIVKEIYAGGSIKVSITENLDDLDNKDKVLVIGSTKTIKYTYQTSSELMENYFKIIDESNSQILELIDKFKIQKQQFFPIHGFYRVNNNIKSAEILKVQQIEKLDEIKKNNRIGCRTQHITISDIEDDNKISNSNKIGAILYSILKGNIDIDLVRDYLINYEDKKSTDYRRVLCAYDYIKYGKEY